MSISEKTAYLKGLLEGLDIDKTKPEGKLIAAIVDVLDDMANDVKVLYSETDHINDYLDELDCDLGDVEEYLYGEDGEDDGEWYDDEDEDYEPATVCDGCEAEDCENCEFNNDSED